MNNKPRIIIACDFDSKEELFNLINKLGNKKLFLKLGMQIIYKEGFGLVKELKKLGHFIFVDLKVHDIPNTAKNAVKSLLSYKPDFITIHTLGGYDMMKEIINVSQDTSSDILGVTILTSLGQKGIDELNINKPVAEEVEELILLAKKAGLTHIVCSAQEANIAKKHNMISITPGIRLSSGDTHDQARVVTPKDAFANGSDYIVVGRALTLSSNPLEVYTKIEKEIPHETNS